MLNNEIVFRKMLNIVVLEWPSPSPDGDTIENLST